MKRFSVVLVLIFLTLFTFTSCESLGLSDYFDFKSWNWNIFDTEQIKEETAEASEKVVAIIEDSASKVSEKVSSTVEKAEKTVVPIIEEKIVPVVEEVVVPVVEEKIVPAVENVVVPVVEEVKQETYDIVKEVSEWFDVKEEQVKETTEEVKEVVEETKEVVETTAQSLEKSVTDVLKSMENEPIENPVIVVPAKENTVAVEKTEPEVKNQEPVALTATEQANASEPVLENVDSIGSSAVLIIILIAVGLIGIAIAYYCISIKKKSY